MTPEMLSKVALWRQQALDNLLSVDEMKEAILFLRNERRSAANSSATRARAAAKVAIPSADDLISDMMGDGA